MKVILATRETTPDRLPLTACTGCTKGLEGPFVRRFLTSHEVSKEDDKLRFILAAREHTPGRFPLTVCTQCTRNPEERFARRFIPLMRYNLW